MNFRLTETLLAILLLSPLVAAAPPATARGPAIPITPGDEPWVVTKLRVTDCRAVRGFVGAPVDGSLKSAQWDGKVWEYPTRDAGAGVGYNYLHNDGLHITLADDAGFNAVLVRGGVKAQLFRDVARYDDPKSGQPVCEFAGGGATTSRAWFDERVKTSRVSFFNVADGKVADCSFFRVRRGLGELGNARAATAEESAGTPPVVLSQQLDEETGLAALGVDFELDAASDAQTTFTISIADPLDPRLELHGADYTVTGGGRVRVVCDFPDQVVPAGTKLTATLSFDRAAKLHDVKLTQFRVPKEQAAPEALEYRKFLLHALYTPLSEARPWNIWNNFGDDKKYFDAGKTGNDLQDRLRPYVREMCMTLDQCLALDPQGKDEVVRQYHEWIYRKILGKSKKGFPKFETKYDHIDGVPEWAALAHQAWMQAREVPRWWLEHRMTPDGELGGEVGDDTDMYGNYAPFPFFERDGVGAMVRDAGERLAELAEKENLELGVNKNSMDPLHAYEEGMNLESELAYWNYGDPVYLERCLMAARSTEKMTILTDKGHRHFRNNDEGVKDVTTPGPLEGEHGTHCLMWQPTLVTAWYNRNPLAMQWLTQWGDGWLEHMKPGDEANAVKLPEDVTSKTDTTPFNGGWGMTGSVFTFLADLTGDARFVRPYTDYFTSQHNDPGVHLPEILQMGMLPSPDKTVAELKPAPWSATLYTTGDKRPFIDAIKKDIEELERFPYMYTQVECFTDRVFLYAIINPSIAYTGGYTTRNKLNLTYAISYEGLFTDYAALVTSATPQHLKVLLCNISDKPISGGAQLWRLEPGEYELTTGPDEDNDDQADRVEHRETISVTRGDEITLNLPPKTVQVLELKQTKRAEPIYGRADLAIAQRQLKRDGNKLTGVVHNIGGKDAEDFVVSLIDIQGKAVQTKHLGKVAAPSDLVPKMISFSFDDVPADATGWSVAVDPENAVAEIFKGNNRASVQK